MNNIPITIINIVFLGAHRVGKTALVNRYLHDAFSPECGPTVYYGHSVKKFSSYRMHILDTNSQTDGHDSNYYKDFDGAFILCDVNDVDTLRIAVKYLDLINRKCGYEKKPCYLIVNKIDVNYDKLYEFLPYYELLTSHIENDDEKHNLINPEPESEFDRLLEEYTPQFDRVFKVSMKKPELNKVSLDNIADLMNKDINIYL